MRTAVGAMAVLFIFWSAAWAVERHPVYKPDYKRVTLDDIFEVIRTTGKFGEEQEEKPELTETEYEEIFKQTGLGKPAVDYLIENSKDYESEIKAYQKIFFDGYPYTCAKIGLLTYNERMRDKNGHLLKGLELVDLEPGDILINFSAHTLGYRHGHCAIVVSKPAKGEEAETIEALYLGEPTEYQTTGKWRSCPTLVHLRISKEAAESKGYTQAELGRLMSEYAEGNCLNIDYGLFPSMSNIQDRKIHKTHCSHLIWYIFKQFGYDVDSNGGIVVTPADIAESDVFEVVQIYGIDPDLKEESR
ncbi:hypothetical protein EQM06_07945 [Aminipila luticellarii]|uniref:Uncharacterized protein n=2 Tax=Aminipila luticellarii TaxID=2507160 RepID=A0A410PW75_9FIRM|nr:hypothetical protein EQM06_07945 [Aminipila luticellarii]